MVDLDFPEGSYGRQNPQYRDATENMLDGVMIKMPASPSVSIYKTGNPNIAVPGGLEFVGLHKPIRKLLEAGLIVHTTDYDGKVIDDLFPDLSEDERVALLRSCDPSVLGYVVDVLHFYHQDRMQLEGITSSGGHTNWLEHIYDLIHEGEQNPFSKELTDEIDNLCNISEFDMRVLFGRTALTQEALDTLTSLIGQERVEAMQISSHCGIVLPQDVASSTRDIYNRTFLERRIPIELKILAELAKQIL